MLIDNRVGPSTLSLNKGCFVLDLARRELRDAAGGRITLRPNAFDVLDYLGNRAGLRVSKDELLRAVWPDVIVTENSLAQCIGEIRTVLGDVEHTVVCTEQRRGYRLVVDEQPNENIPATTTPSEPAMQQDIRFVQSEPGVRIAYGVSGSGPAMVRIMNWASHLQYNFQVLFYAHLREFAKSGCYIQYDPRGSGLSTRDVAAGLFSDWVTDLSAVIDAAGLVRTGLFAYTIGGATAVRYAILHPERVSFLILNGAVVRGPSARGASKEFSQAFIKLLRDGWARENPAIRQMSTRHIHTDATAEELASLETLHRAACSGEFVASVIQASLDVDVTEDLPKLKCPTLIIHSLRDKHIPFEEACRTASLIPGAQLEPIDSANNFALPSDPQFAKWRQLVSDFAKKHG